jgi:hypothetical protein
LTEQERKQLEYRISVMQGFLEGKEVEFRGANHWITVSADIPSWNWEAYQYRLKRESYSGWIVLHGNGFGRVFANEDQAKYYESCDENRRATFVSEVEKP